MRRILAVTLSLASLTASAEPITLICNDDQGSFKFSNLTIDRQAGTMSGDFEYTSYAEDDKYITAGVIINSPTAGLNAYRTWFIEKATGRFAYSQVSRFKPIDGDVFVTADSATGVCTRKPFN